MSLFVCYKYLGYIILINILIHVICVCYLKPVSVIGIMKYMKSNHPFICDIIIVVVFLFYIFAARLDCPVTKFRCSNHICVNHRFVCDGINTCGDNSDESICKNHISEISILPITVSSI